MVDQRFTDRYGSTFAAQRQQMVAEQLRSRHIRDERVLIAMASVPRHEFVPKALQSLAYTNQPLPIGYEQTISQPYVVAYMLEAAQLQPEDRVLEIGAGSGYEAALLGELVAEVYTLEIIPELANHARELLRTLGYQNIQVKTGNGYGGWPEHAPYDAIIGTAAPKKVPEPLLEQLALNGRAIIPVGHMYQDLIVCHRTPDGIQQRKVLPVRFVPMTGKPS